jgi:hypothetical protein
MGARTIKSATSISARPISASETGSLALLKGFPRQSGFSITGTPARAARSPTAALSGGDQNGRQIDLPPSQLDQQVQAVHLRQLVIDDEASIVGDIGVFQQFGAYNRLARRTLDLQCDIQRVSHGGSSSMIRTFAAANS